MPEYLLGGPKIPYPWEMIPGAMSALGRLFPSSPSPAPPSDGQTVESYQYPFSQLTPESMKLGMNAPPVEKPIVPPPTPGVNLATPPPAPAPKSPVELARAEAESLYQQHIKAGKAPTEFGLPWDFFTKHGDISGGVFVGPQGPKFLFNENRPQNMTDMMAPLIQKYVEQMTRIQSGNLQGNELAKALWETPSLEKIYGPMAHMMTAQTGQAKAPAEIANLYSQATRPTITPNIYAGGPGEMATLYTSPFGGPTKTLATGQQVEHGQGLAVLASNAMAKGQEEKSRLLAQSPEFLADPSKVPEKLLPLFNQIDEWTRNNINALHTMLGANRAPGGGVTPGAGTKMSKNVYMQSIYAKNPNITPQQAEAQYWQDKRAYPNLVE
jgi:hypothetical protein